MTIECGRLELESRDDIGNGDAVGDGDGDTLCGGDGM